MKPYDEGEMEGRRGRSNANRINAVTRRSTGARMTHNDIGIGIGRYPSWRHQQTQPTAQQRNVANNTPTPITRAQAAAVSPPDTDAFSVLGTNQSLPRESAGNSFTHDASYYAASLTSQSQEQARSNDMVFADTSRSALGTTSTPASSSAIHAGALEHYYYKEKHDEQGEEAKMEEEQAMWDDMVHPDTSRSDIAAVSSTIVDSSGNLTSNKKNQENGRNQGRERAQPTQQRINSIEYATPTGANTTAPPISTTGAFAVSGHQTVQRGGEADTFTQLSAVGTTFAQHSAQNSVLAPNQSNEGGSALHVQAHLAHPSEEVLDSQERRIQQLEALVQQQQQQLQQTTAPLAHAEIASFVAPLESHDNNDDEAPPPPPPVEEPRTIMEPQEKMLNEKCFTTRQSHLIGLGVLLLLIGVALAVAIPLAIDSNSPSTPAPTPAPSPNPTPIALLPNGPWKPLGQELGGKAEDDYFGRFVSLSRDTRVLAVGANQPHGRPGHVSVFESDSNRSWVAKGQELVGEANDDQFGWSVALNGNGTVLAVGAYQNSGGGAWAGHVRVFEHDTSTNRWVPLGSDIDGVGWYNFLGYSVSLSDAGDILAVGAHHHDNWRGLVRIFRHDRDTDSWEQFGQTLVGQAAGDEFGYSVSLSSSGAILSVGARRNDVGAMNAGQVSLYLYNSESSEWDPLGSPINGQVVDGLFGESVSFDDSGVVVAVGAPGAWDDSAFTDARVFVFAYDSATSEWTQHGQTLKSQEPGSNFGESVSLSGNGNVLAVGSRYHDANGLSNSGQVTIFQHNTNTMEWDTVGEPLNGKAAYDNFGESVSLSEDGTIVAVGADGRDFNDTRQAGSASVYTLN